MITLVKAFGQVTGSELLLLSVILCTLFFAVIFLLFKTNRNNKSIVYYLLGVFTVLEICDFIWLSYLFPNGEYVNRGIQGGWTFLLLPLLLVILNTSFTIVNKKKLNKVK